LRPSLGRAGIWAGAATATALSLLLAVTAPAAPPSLTVVATDATIGQTIGAAVSLSESPTATGEISFEVFGSDDSTCTGTALETSQATVSGEGEYASAEFTPTTAGLYYWSARYSGDGENPAAEALCAAVSTVAKATPGLTANASAGVLGGTIHDEATVTGGFSSTGEISFSVFAPADTDCSTPLATTLSPLASGAAISAEFAPQQAGEFRWTVTYAGDVNNEGTELSCNAANQTSMVSKASPNLSGTATSTAVVGQTITDAVHLNGGFNPGGELTFRAYGPNDETCATTPKYEASVAVAGNGSYSPPGFAPGPGLYRWTVEYGGDVNNGATALACNASGQSSTVTKAAPSLIGAASSALVGTAIRNEVTLTGGFSPSGEMTFSIFGPTDTSCATPLKTAAVLVAGDTATSADFIPQQAGEFHWTASYSGDANNEARSLGCNAAGQTSSVAKASPNLAATATSTVVVGNTITDQATLSGGFSPGGELTFRAYGPNDPNCGSPPAYEAAVPVGGNGPYSPPGFAPGPGLYRWTVVFGGDVNNGATALACDASGQGSAVGAIDLVLENRAVGGTVGTPVTATATVREAAIPGGQLVFKAFPPGDTNCSGAAAFSSSVEVVGNGSYRSAAFVPTRVGSFRWTVAYSGDPNHAPATTACGNATSAIVPAKPTIAGAVPQRVLVGTAFRDAATLQGGYSPGGTITFRIYGPASAGCDGPAFVNTVAVNGNGTVNSDPFVALRTGRYSFTASYSGDAENQAAAESCDSPAQAVQVVKRAPKVRPRAGLVGGRKISIRARLSGAASPSGAVTFRLYGPGDKRCTRKPAFSGGVTVKSNGTFPLARYIATRAGVYRLSVGYSGDQRNQRYRGRCDGAQAIRVGQSP
jgi:hypothetical protein